MELEKFIVCRSWREHKAHLEEPYVEVKAECRQRAAGPATHAFIRGRGRVLWSSHARARLVNSSQEWGFGKRKAPRCREVGEAVGEFISGTYICL